ncbi:hypothetical protein D3C76_1271510 [compost metagenome]
MKVHTAAGEVGQLGFRAQVISEGDRIAVDLQAFAVCRAHTHSTDACARFAHYLLRLDAQAYWNTRQKQFGHQLQAGEQHPWSSQQFGQGEYAFAQR